MPYRLTLLALLYSLAPSAHSQSAAHAQNATIRAIAVTGILSDEVAAGQADEAAETIAGDDAVEAEVNALASDSFQRRKLARQRLLRAGEGSRDALVAGLSSPELEVRLASRELLIWLSETALERRIADLVGGNAKEIDLPGWKQFAAAVGDTPVDRALFARIVRTHGPSLAWLDRLDTVASSNETLSEMNVFLPIDIAAINQGDPDQWGLLLLAASHPELRTAPVLSSRLRGGLLNPVVAERLRASSHQHTLRRLIAHWLEVSSDRYINESMLKISLFYECGEIAPRLALTTLQSRQATPASVVAAMTVLARLEPEIARQELPRSIDDARVWHIVATRRGPIRSQVGDVALALLLYLDNRDPREVGFDGVVADPLTIYRDYSLGFDDDAHRRRAHEGAERLLDLRSVRGSHDVLTEDQ